MPKTTSSASSSKDSIVALSSKDNPIQINVSIDKTAVENIAQDETPVTKKPFKNKEKVDGKAKIDATLDVIPSASLNSHIEAAEVIAKNTEDPSPKKRGRPSKINKNVLPIMSVKEDGGDSTDIVIIETAPKSEKKRGRPKLNHTIVREVGSDSNVPKKKRGRPFKVAKISESNVAVEGTTSPAIKAEPKKRGRPFKPKTDQPLAKKQGRGRPKKIKPSPIENLSFDEGTNNDHIVVASSDKETPETITEATPITTNDVSVATPGSQKKRGRPKKSIQPTTPSDSTPAKKRGRPPLSDVHRAITSESQSLKKRGRPKSKSLQLPPEKAAAVIAMTVEHNNETWGTESTLNEQVPQNGANNSDSIGFIPRVSTLMYETIAMTAAASKTKKQKLVAYDSNGNPIKVERRGRPRKTPPSTNAVTDEILICHTGNDKSNVALSSSS